MPILPCLWRWRLCLVGFLLLAGVLGGTAILWSWGTESPERIDYDRIQVGMTREQVFAILRDWSHYLSIGSLRWCHMAWHAPNGARIRVSFDADNKVTDKDFKEGDLSFRGRLKRLARRLPIL